MIIFFKSTILVKCPELVPSTLYNNNKKRPVIKQKYHENYVKNKKKMTYNM